MGIFGKMFGRDKLELTEDDIQDKPNEKKKAKEEKKTINQNPSPFLVDDEEDIKKS